MAATAGENWIEGDSLLDWLDLYVAVHGFVRDDLREGYDPRTDFHRFLRPKASGFEAAIIKLLGAMHLPVDLPDSTKAGTPMSPLRIPADLSFPPELRARSLTTAGATVAAMSVGAHLIAGGVLRNPETRTYGAPNLLMRFDVLEALFPGSLPCGMEEAVYPALGLEPGGLEPGTGAHFTAAAGNPADQIACRRHLAGLRDNCPQWGAFGRWIYLVSRR